MNRDGLRSALHDLADDVDLRAGDVRAVKATGLRRRHRHRRAGVAATAAVTIGVTAVGIHVLTRPPGTVVSNESGPGSAPARDASAGARPATVAAPTMSWRTVVPDSVAAVSMSIGPDYLASPPVLPGLMVSTGPGRSDPRRRLWHSDDGVVWTEVAALPDGTSTTATWTDGSRVYVVGTLPGVAGAPSPVRVTTSSDGGVTWDGIDLPLANPALEQLAGDIPIVTQIGGVTGTGDVTMVLVRQRLSIDDPGPLLRELGFDPATAYVFEHGVGETPCPPPPTTAPADAEVPVATTPPCEVSPGSDRVTPWSELGPRGAQLQAGMVFTSRLLVTTDGSRFAEVPLPAAGLTGETQIMSAGGAVVLVARPFGDERWTMWRTTDGATWEPMPAFDEGFGFGGPVRTLDGRTVALGLAMDRPAVALGDGAGWEYVDLAPLLAPDEHVMQANLVTTSPGGLTVAALVGTPSSDTAVTIPGSSIPATTAPAAADDGATETTVSYVQEEMSWVLLHTTDGVSWSRQSVAELAGVDDAEISQVTRVQRAGDTVVVALNLRAAQDTLATQLVLVGTPNG